MWARILAIVVGALAAAQVVTLVLTVFFPPAPPSQYSLTDISAALRGGEAEGNRDRPLVLSFEDTAPSLASPGWMVSPPATKDLARMVGAAETDVRLLFYAPPPLAGAPMPPPPGHGQPPRPRPMSSMIQVGQAGGAGGPPPMPMVGPGRMPGSAPMMRPGAMGSRGGPFPSSQRVFQRPPMPQQQMSRPMMRPSG